MPYLSWFRNGILQFSTLTKKPPHTAPPPSCLQLEAQNIMDWEKNSLLEQQWDKKWTVTATVLIIKVFKRELFTCKNGHCRPYEKKQDQTVPLPCFLNQKEPLPPEVRGPFPLTWQWPEVVCNNLPVLGTPPPSYC